MFHLFLFLFTLVSLNCENLFDTYDDPLKQDEEFLPDADRHWTATRYWRKLDRLGKTIIACGEDSVKWQLPDLVALCEVENDTVLCDLTRRSLLRNARYDYFVTSSPDERGINVALLYSPFTFLPVNRRDISIQPIKGMRPTRDILYVSGIIPTGDTLHVFVVHAPSRRDGEFVTRPYRQLVISQLTAATDSIRGNSPNAQIIIAGDFNNYSDEKPFVQLRQHDLVEVSRYASGPSGIKGTYRYRGVWQSLDHVVCSSTLAATLQTCYIAAFPFLLESDNRYGGLKPKRTYYGPRYNDGLSDHLPLVARFRFS